MLTIGLQAYHIQPVRSLLNLVWSLYNLPKRPSSIYRFTSGKFYCLVSLQSAIQSDHERMPRTQHNGDPQVFNVLDSTKSQRSASMVTYAVNTEQLVVMSKYCHKSALYGRVESFAVTRQSRLSNLVPVL